MSKDKELTIVRLLEVLEFDESISRFRWKERPGSLWFNTRFAGKLAGSERANNKIPGLFYRIIGIDNVLYKEHRLVWLLHTGQFPEFDLDHKDGDGLNNRLDNLRLSVGGINLQNKARYSSNTSGHTGVSWSKQKQKWQVIVRLNKRSYCNGSFNLEDLDKAAAAAAELRARLGFSPTHGLTRSERRGLPATR